LSCSNLSILVGARLVGTLILSVVSILLHEVTHVEVKSLAIDNDGLDIEEDVEHASGLLVGEVAPLVHGGTVDGDITGAHDALLAAAEAELHLTLAAGADNEGQGAVEVGLGARGKVDHADADTVGDVQRGADLGELDVGVAVQVDGVAGSAVENVLGSGASNHGSTVVTMVGLEEDSLALLVVAADVAVGDAEAGGREVSAGTGGRHCGLCLDVD
jgi:hypothetical protein